MNKDECMKILYRHISKSEDELVRKKHNTDNENTKQTCNDILNELQQALEYLQRNLK